MSITSNTTQNKALSLLPIGSKIEVTGGLYKRKTGVILGHTSKMYCIQLEDGRECKIRQYNARLAPEQETPDEMPKVDALTEKELYRKLIESEVKKVNRSLVLITKYLEKLEVV